MLISLDLVILFAWIDHVCSLQTLWVWSSRWRTRLSATPTANLIIKKCSLKVWVIRGYTSDEGKVISIIFKSLRHSKVKLQKSKPGSSHSVIVDSCCSRKNLRFVTRALHTLKHGAESSSKRERRRCKTAKESGLRLAALPYNTRYPHSSIRLLLCTARAQREWIIARLYLDAKEGGI